MCGIAGCWDLNATTAPTRLSDVAARMAGQLAHRGPNDAGTWTDAAAGVAFGHRRLAIIDLSPAGHQPMQSPSGRLTLVYNGELYNHEELRAELTTQGCSFRGHSDTEVLLAAIEAYGVRAALERANGMFALAVWDRDEQSLTLARDRLGIKPLYYGRFGGHFVFASELKALREHPQFTWDVNRAALAAFLQHSYIPAPLSIYRQVQKLPAGTVLTMRRTSDLTPHPEPYWSLDAAIELGRANAFQGTPTEAAAELKALLQDSVRRQRLADVPVGALLSGGVDSTTVVALMASENRAAVRTFTMGFDNPAYDESRFAAPIAAHLQVENIAQVVAAADAQSVIPDLPEMYDEPFADSSQIPTFLISRLARQHVTVALSGDGGDELFGGYERYRRISRIWRLIGWLPAGVRRAMGVIFQRCRRLRAPGTTEPSHWSRVLAAKSARALYETLHRHWPRPENVVLGNERAALPPWTDAGRPADTFLESMIAIDTVGYLPDCILTKVDRASMAVGLEARVPLLDHRVVEFAWRLPLSIRHSPARPKPLFRHILAEYVPNALLDRPKRGFGIPLGEWIRGPLRDWSEELLAADRLARDGFLNVAAVREKWTEHFSGQANWQYLLWDVLMFQAWLDRWRN